MLGQQTITTIRTTQEENAEYLETSRSQQMKLLLGAAGLVVLLGLGTYASVGYSSAKNLAKEAKQLAVVSQTAAADKARYDEAFATAQTTLATPDWRVMMQSVRSRDRVLKQAQWVYSRVPYKPMHLINYQFPQDMHVGEDAFVRLYVTAKEIGTGFWIRLEHSGYGWQLDWEALGGYTREHWSAFVDERPTGIDTYRVHLQRSSIPDRHYFERGFSGDGDAFAVKIWALEGDKYVHAIVDASSKAGQALAETLSWDTGAGYITRLSWPENIDPDSSFQFVDLVEVIQPGWHISDQTEADVAVNSAIGGNRAIGGIGGNGRNGSN